MFTTFLNEGLIKLPPKVLSGAVEFFLRKYLAYLWYHSKKLIKDETDKQIIETALKKIASVHGVENPTSSEVTSIGRLDQVHRRIPANDIPKEYLDRLLKVKGKVDAEQAKNIILTLTINLKNRKSTGGIYFSRKGKIVLSLKGLSLAISDIGTLLETLNIKEIQHRINRAIGTIEHELTHFVQSKVLSLLHGEQFDIVNYTPAEESEEKYLSDPVEFDPWIKTSIRKLKNLIDKEKKSLTAREVFNIFTWSDADPKDKDVTHPELRSQFFSALKKKNLNSWKKAVKLLSKEVL